MAHDSDTRSLHGGPINALVTVAIILGAIGCIGGAFGLGLWLGERGRRQAAERLLVNGTPSEPVARRLADQPDAEARVLAAGRQVADRQFSKDTIDKGVEHIMAEAKLAGRPISRENAREQALAMLSGSSEQPLDLPELGV